MAELVFILGDSGSGKTTSLRNLDPKKTFILQTVRKSLPFKGGRKDYSLLTKENMGGNLGFSPDYETVLKQLNYVSKNTDKELLIIDDSNYLLSNDFMSRIMTKATKGDAFQKYNEIAYNFHNLTKVIEGLRENLTVVMMAHTQSNDDGTRTFKTIGRLLDEKIKLEGLVSIILESCIKEGEYKFQTNKIDGSEPCKTPMGMFEEKFVDNDLKEIIQIIKEY